MLREIETKEIWTGRALAGVRHPSNIDDLWSDAELLAVGLERFTPPVLPAPPRRVGTFIEFMDKFTEAEQATILTAARRNPALDLVLFRASAANRIDLDDKRLAIALEKFVAAGLVSVEKVTALKSGSF